jgi:hypothetical protein
MIRVKTGNGEYRAAIETSSKKLAHRDHYTARVSWIVRIRAGREQEEIPVDTTPLKEHWDERRETAIAKATDEFRTWVSSRVGSG